MKKLSGVPALVLCALFWSSGGLLVKFVNYNSFAIAGVRSFIALCFLMIALKKFPKFVIYRDETGPQDNAALTDDTPATSKDAGSGKAPASFKARRDRCIDRGKTCDLWLAGITYALTMTFYILGNKLTTAANTIILEYTGPLYIIMFGPAILGEKNRRSDYVTAAGVLAGMVLLMSDGLSTGNHLGNFLAALSGVSFGFSTIFMRKLRGDNSENAFMLSHIINVVLWSPFIIMAGAPDMLSLCGLLLMGVFQNGIPSILYSRGLDKVPALTGSFISIIEPLMNPVWVFIATGEHPTLLALFGGVLIIGFVTMRSAVQKKG